MEPGCTARADGRPRRDRHAAATVVEVLAVDLVGVVVADRGVHEVHGRVADPTLDAATDLVGGVAGKSAPVQFHMASERVNRSTIGLLFGMDIDYPQIIPCLPTMIDEMRLTLEQRSMWTRYNFSCACEVAFPTRRTAPPPARACTTQKNIKEGNLLLSVVTLPP